MELDLFGDPIVTQSQSKINDEKADLYLRSIGVDPDVSHWTKPIWDQIHERALGDKLEIKLEEEMDAFIEEARQYYLLQRKHGSIFNKEVKRSLKVSFIDCIAWINGLTHETFSFVGVVAAANDRPEYFGLNPFEWREDLMLNFGKDASDALAYYNGERFMNDKELFL